MLLPPAVDDFISRDSPTRAIDAFVDSLDLRSIGFSVRDDFAQGRSSYHPSTLLKLYLWGYFAQTRSSRRLEEASQSNLNAIWLTGNLRPDHSTISRFRKKQATDLAEIFGQFTTVCLQLGLYGRELIAIDGTFIKAVNSRTESYTKAQLEKLVEKILGVTATVAPTEKSSIAGKTTFGEMARHIRFTVPAGRAAAIVPSRSLAPKSLPGNSESAYIRK